ncbi:hypothetical protein HanRHA438_Chr17g0802211 [Helianthus annuus]|nr:hypothetical protein HanHA89_Chr17g0697301 [Helianthus annuus]KAJ0825344.1 hypothetical protein HanRHA438_Chr17g0802211 [Helianthus annuus]
MADVGRIGVILKLIDIVNVISMISDYWGTLRKPFFNLSRRLKMLNPLFEEFCDVKEAVPDESFRSLVSLMEALEYAKELLRLGSERSKIYLGFGFVCVDLGGLIVD